MFKITALLYRDATEMIVRMALDSDVKILVKEDFRYILTRKPVGKMEH